MSFLKVRSTDYGRIKITVLTLAIKRKNDDLIN